MKIETYLLQPGEIITDLEAAKGDPDSFFVPIQDQAALSSIVSKIDWYYLEGAIRIHYGEQTLLDFEHWDLVDQLWAYFLNLIDEVLDKGSATTHFPDQPTQLQMKRTSPRMILFTLSANGKPQKTLVPEYDLFTGLLTGAKEFYQTMLPYTKLEPSYQHELHKIARLEQRIN